MFDPFLFKTKKPASKQAPQDTLDGFRCQEMVNSAKRILLTSHESDEAYLGAITVLMLNGVL